jgi:hypothetical protein
MEFLLVVSLPRVCYIFSFHRALNVLNPPQYRRCLMFQFDLLKLSAAFLTYVNSRELLKLSFEDGSISYVLLFLRR